MTSKRFMLCVVMLIAIAVSAGGCVDALGNAATAMGDGTVSAFSAGAEGMGNAATAMGDTLAPAAQTLVDAADVINPVRIISEMSAANAEKQRLAKEAKEQQLREIRETMGSRIIATLQDADLPSEYKDSVCHYAIDLNVPSDETAKAHGTDVATVERLKEHWYPPLYREIVVIDRKSKAQFAFIFDPENKNGPYFGPRLDARRAELVEKGLLR